MRKFWTGVVAASFMTVGLAAQQDPPAPGAPGAGAPRPAPSAQATSQSKSVTLSGCIQNAPGSATATAGGGAAGDKAAATASTSGAKFVLANAKMSGGGAVGTAGGAGTRYELSGEDKTISPHVNHQVEVTGTIESSASAGAAGAKASGPTLKVESVKMVSATCS